MKRNIFNKEELNLFFSDKYAILFMIMYEAKVNHKTARELTYEEIQKDEWLIGDTTFKPSNRLKELVKYLHIIDFKEKFGISQSALNIRIRNIIAKTNKDYNGFSTHSFKLTKTEEEKFEELKKKFS